ncbi:hypothetical protein D6C91_07209 [Aureobasidium pullulans]|uniref:F-box domain-containing protein n=1 Tax=Aureobasidium pullulans TaxID=5580 RepID=A0A4S9SU37_AURPU|nr:hypothetical protein D6C91_07209 [Aureobasidium pullulans]
MVANDRSTNTTTSTPNQPDIMDLPPEVLVEIFNLIDNKDLPNVRLTCKKLCEAANRPFGFANFTERAHVVSPYSINALVDITEHPIFGSYVKSVGICSARAGLEKDYLKYYRVDRDTSDKVILNGYVKTGRFGRSMKRVFDNIRMHSQSVTISVYNDKPEGTRFDNEPCLAPKLYFGWAQLIEQSPGAPVFEPAETLEQTVYAARRAGCLIKRIRMDRPSPNLRFRGEIQKRLDMTIQQVLESSITPLDFHIDGIRYHDESASLEISKFMPRLREDRLHQCPLNAFYCWVKAKKIARLRFHHNSYFNIRHFQPLLTSHLRYLRLDQLCVRCRYLNINLWSEHIQSLCGLRGLRYCRFERLRYECDLEWGDISDISYLYLPGQGEYVCDYDSFHLLFRDGTISFEAKGESVCTELKGLVCYLEASEEQKRSQIIREGLVSHDKIGIVD